MFSFNTTYAALTAITANTIKGNEPYITIEDNGTTREIRADLYDLFSINYGATQYTPATPNLATSPLYFEVGDTIDKITSSIGVSLDGSTHLLSTIAALNYADKDGDAGDKKGEITAKWTYEDEFGVEVQANLNDVVDACKAPYTLKISAKNIAAKSNFGDPIDKTYGTLSHSYTFKVKNHKFCAIKPLSMTVNSCSGSTANCKYPNGYDQSVFKPGDVRGGFFPTATTKFPTVGFDKGKFTLIMSNGEDSYEFTSSNSLVSPIDNNGVVAFNSSSSPIMPLTVTLTATPKDTTFPPIYYTFTLNKWGSMQNSKQTYSNNFILSSATQFPAATACKLGAGDVTDSTTAATYFYQVDEITNQTATNYDNASYSFFSRAIDGTFQGEWGILHDYYSILGSYIWTGEVAPSAVDTGQLQNKQWGVDMYGSIGSLWVYKQNGLVNDNQHVVFCKR